MSTPNIRPQAEVTEFAEQTHAINTVGPVEDAVNAIGLVMLTGGSVVSLFYTEIGYPMIGAGAGLLIGGLAVGYSIRRGNG